MLPGSQSESQPASQPVSQMEATQPYDPGNIEQLHQNALTVLDPEVVEQEY